jgi:hypothetical protein
MGCLTDRLTRTVLVDRAVQVVLGQAYDLLILRGSEIQHVRDRNVAGDQTPRGDLVTGHAFDGLDQVSVCLCDHRLGGPRDVEHRISPLGSPPTPRRTACERPILKRAMTLKDPSNFGRAGLRHGSDESSIHPYMAPEARRSISAKTGSNSPAPSMSIGF